MKHRHWIMLILLAFLTSGCTASCQNEIKHMQSSVFGLNRRIVLYLPDGTTKEWTTTAQVEDHGGSCHFLTMQGKSVRIGGVYTIEEL